MRFLDYMSTGRGRLIRTAVGLAMIGAGLATGGPSSILVLAGLLPLATGVFNLCPISPIFGRSCRGNACRTR
jgi:membrane-associated protease RseP (regulator of RpoE activity)